MAITMKMLNGFNLPEDVKSALLEAHLETVNGLKAERDQYKADAEKLPEIQKQLAEAQSALEAANKEDYKGKYESEKAAHDKLKADTAAEKTRTAKESALREALKTAGYSEAGITKIIKYSGLTDTVELDEHGKATNCDAVLKSADTEWSEYKGKAEPAAASVANPPAVASESNQKSKAADIVAQIQREFYGEQPNESKKEG